MALTDTEIRKAKAKDTAYRLSDGGGLHLWITPQATSSGAGNTDSRAARS